MLAKLVGFYKNDPAARAEAEVKVANSAEKVEAAEAHVAQLYERLELAANPVARLEANLADARDQLENERKLHAGLERMAMLLRGNPVDDDDPSAKVAQSVRRQTRLEERIAKLERELDEVRATSSATRTVAEVEADIQGKP